ncbi:MAG: hypothetical protein V4616_04655, partial [Bacteroidota bacterium]
NRAQEAKAQRMWDQYNMRLNEGQEWKNGWGFGQDASGSQRFFNLELMSSIIQTKLEGFQRQKNGTYTMNKLVGYGTKKVKNEAGEEFNVTNTDDPIYNLVTRDLTQQSQLNPYFQPYPREEKEVLGPLNNYNGGIGLLAGVIENTVSTATIGTNLKVYPNGWTGNRFVSTTNVSRVAKVAGTATLVIGTLLDIRGVYNYYEKGSSDPNAVHPAKAGSNFSVGAWGMLNPGTAIGAAMYFGIDTFYPGGFPAAMQKNAEMDNAHRELTGQGLWSGPKY